MTIRVSLVLSIFLLTASLFGDSPITIRRANIAPSSRSANIVLSVRIEKSDFDREIEVSCESEDNFASSSQPLDGSNHPAQILFEFNLAQGHYECRAKLTRTDDEKFYDSARLFVAR